MSDPIQPFVLTPPDPGLKRFLDWVRRVTIARPEPVLPVLPEELSPPVRPKVLLVDDHHSDHSALLGALHRVRATPQVIEDVASVRGVTSQELIGSTPSTFHYRVLGSALVNPGPRDLEVIAEAQAKRERKAKARELQRQRSQTHGH